jgi:hypothetical protein
VLAAETKVPTAVPVAAAVASPTPQLSEPAPEPVENGSLLFPISMGLALVLLAIVIVWLARRYSGQK